MSIKSLLSSLLILVVFFKGNISFLLGSDLIAEFLAFLAFCILLFVSGTKSFKNPISSILLVCLLSSVVFSLISTPFVPGVFIGNLIYSIIIIYSLNSIQIFYFTPKKFWIFTSMLGISMTLLELVLRIPLSAASSHTLGKYETEFITNRLSSITGSATTFSIVATLYIAILLYYNQSSNSRIESIFLNLQVFLWFCFAILTFNRGIYLAYTIALITFLLCIALPKLVKTINNGKFCVSKIILFTVLIFATASLPTLFPEIAARYQDITSLQDASNVDRLNRYELFFNIRHFSFFFGGLMNYNITNTGVNIQNMLFPSDRTFLFATESSILYLAGLFGFPGCMLAYAQILSRINYLNQLDPIKCLFFGILSYTFFLQLFDVPIFLLTLIVLANIVNTNRQTASSSYS